MSLCARPVAEILARLQTSTCSVNYFLTSQQFTPNLQPFLPQSRHPSRRLEYVAQRSHGFTTLPPGTAQSQAYPSCEHIGLTEVVDPDYRYKMPRIQGKVEGRGNGIKTAVVNMRDVANSLHREPGEVTKFFGCELGAQTNWNEGTERSIVNGSHTDAMLQSLLTKYIELFVLCPSCHLPESTYKIKGGLIYHNCLACGAREGIDMEHKLTTFILNAAKKAKKAKSKDGKDAKKKKDKDGKDKDKKEKKKKDKTTVKHNGESSAHHVKLSRKSSGDGSNESTDENDNEITATLDNLEVDDAGALDNCISSFRRYIQDGSGVEILVEEARTMQTFSALPVPYRFHIYVLAVCEDAESINVALVNSMVPVLKALGSSAEDQHHLIGCLELLCMVRAPSLKPQFPLLLKLLYDADIVEEENILAWANAGYTEEYSYPGVDADKVNELIRISGPFITWLQEADEESDGE